MNIFALDEDPQIAARMHCDKHVPKMCVEATQMLVSAARRHGATDSQVPLTKSGTPHRGGYHNHPCTQWAGDSRDNYMWLYLHGIALCQEFKLRFGKEHACFEQIRVLGNLFPLIPASFSIPKQSEATVFLGRGVTDENKRMICFCCSRRLCFSCTVMNEMSGLES